MEKKKKKKKYRFCPEGAYKWNREAEPMHMKMPEDDLSNYLKAVVFLNDDTSIDGFQKKSKKQEGLIERCVLGKRGII